jgi:hypothetical protein
MTIKDEGTTGSASGEDGNQVGPAAIVMAGTKVLEVPDFLVLWLEETGREAPSLQRGLQPLLNRELLAV